MRVRDLIPTPVSVSLYDPCIVMRIVPFVCMEVIARCESPEVAALIVELIERDRESHSTTRDGARAVSG